MKKLTITWFLLPIFVICITLKAASQRNDAALWTSIQLEKHITSNWLFHYQQAARFNQNISQLNVTFSDLGATYMLNKHIKTSLNYRFINKKDVESGNSLRHRLYWDVILKKKIKPISLIYRHRLQYQLEDIYSSDDGEVLHNYSRSKFTVKYNINKVTPFVATELYVKIIDWNQLLGNKYRLIAGLDYDFNKTNELSIFYLFNKNFNKKNPLTSYIIGIAYSHTFY
ncbi:MAG: DUF2490 domain-containing protein [Bacteroidota bacterium]